MKSLRKTQVFLPAAELAEIHRDVFSHLAHEVGGISSALGLRADALSTTLAAKDFAAFQSLAAQIRALQRVFRILEGPRDESLFAPARILPAADWWRFVSGVISASLPRGILIAPTQSDANLDPRQAHLLTTILLLACRDIRDRGVSAPATFEARFLPIVGAETGTAVELTILESEWPESPAPRRVGRWQRYAKRVAKASKLDLTWWQSEGATMCWRCQIS